MELAIKQARLCVSEDGRVSPMVGAVVVKPNGDILGKAYRGELKSGEHAEYTLLERKLKNEILAGSTLYTTLEPCTDRNIPKLPCAQHIVDRHIKHVVIGVLDSNPVICGKGERWLIERGIEVTRFDHDLMKQIEELQRYFNRLHRDTGQGTSITGNVGGTRLRPSSKVRTKPTSPSVPASKSNPGSKTSNWDTAAVHPALTSFEKAVGINSDNPEEHEYRREIADELRNLQKFLTARPKQEGEVLAAFVVNANADHQLRKDSFDSQVDAYANMSELDGPLRNLLTAEVLTYDDEDQTIGLGIKHATALEKLCEFFTSGDYHPAKTVLRENNWDSIIPQDL